MVSVSGFLWRSGLGTAFLPLRLSYERPLEELEASGLGNWLITLPTSWIDRVENDDIQENKEQGQATF